MHQCPSFLFAFFLLLLCGLERGNAQDQRASGSAPQNSYGRFDAQGDVGKVLHPGSVVFDQAKQQYTLTGSGTNMWANRDEFHYVWKRIKGDFIVRARAEFSGKGANVHRKLGWTARPSLETDGPHVNATVHGGDGLTSLQYRRTPGAMTEEQKFSIIGPDVIQLERRGNQFIMSVAKFGETFTTGEALELPLGEELYVGIYVCSHDPNVSETAIFRDVEFIRPAPPGFRRYREFLSSTLETLEIATAQRQTLHQIPASLEAPNWTRDGKALIFNQQGLLYRFDLKTKTPTVINTGEVRKNNNDHVISFDGKMLAISSGRPDENGHSDIYTVPLRGGIPKRVTTLSPSYLHGWSPDGKHLVYTARRNDDYDIYRIAITGGEETRLTTTKGLDDGPEYSPDGQWIYFNSVRSGTMQLWRMKPDGSNPAQLTNDGLNNWFPHVSPDGRWLAFLTFGRDVEPSDHPPYQRVYLRLMPAAGGAPRVIAYLYGGQGTLNVPSWSPDSRRIAFVSNTGLFQ